MKASLCYIAGILTVMSHQAVALATNSPLPGLDSNQLLNACFEAMAGLTNFLGIWVGPQVILEHQRVTTMNHRISGY